MKKFKPYLKIGTMGNNTKIMRKYVVKNHKNSKKLHKNDKCWKSYKKYKKPKIKWKECHTFNIYMVLSITFRSNNVLTCHVWFNETYRQKKINQSFALIQIRVWKLSMFYYNFMEKCAPILLVMF